MDWWIGKLLHVIQNIQRISKLLGVNFEGLKDQTMNLFKEIERRRKEKRDGNQALSTKRKTRVDKSRELNRLQSTINCDKGEKKGEGEGGKEKLVI